MSPDERQPHVAPRLDPGAIGKTLRDAGLRARHSLSQNFLADVDVLEAILAEAAPARGRRILEIGPGLGFLTGGLLAAGAAVTAIELDRGLAARLRTEFAGPIAAAGAGAGADPDVPGGLRLIEGDALDHELTALLEPPYDVVANIPYHITSPILHRLLGSGQRPERAVLMVQREVAERIAAPAGSMSYLSVFVQYHARARIAFRVPSAAFEPAPDVESAVVVLEPYTGDDADLLGPEDEDGLWRLVQAAFRERRKMIHNVLGRQLPVEPARLAAALAAARILPDRRPQTLAVGEWLALREALGPIGSDERGRHASGHGRRESTSERDAEEAGAEEATAAESAAEDPR
jgi:16S rRNA (adenine1518-N6/adenine1519-N6)-dimethyltransferase